MWRFKMPRRPRPKIMIRPILCRFCQNDIKTDYVFCPFCGGKL